MVQKTAMIRVDESDYVNDVWVPLFDHRDSVRIRTEEKFSQFYECFDTIGEGKFGKVYLCREKTSGLELAAKRVSIRRDADRNRVEKELEIMTRMRHPRIAQIYDAFCTSKDDIILVMEVVRGGELFDRVVSEEYILTETAVVMIICQLCEALDYIHGQKIVHLDIKPENIMCVSQTGNRIKLIDFGLAQHFDGDQQLFMMAGTPEFAAPEVIMYEPIEFRTDLWSVGIIAYILLSGVSPFLGDNNAETYNNVMRGTWQFDEEAFDGISLAARDFVSRLIVYDKTKRMHARECLQHEWVLEHRARARNDSDLNNPNTGTPIDRIRLRSYVQMRRWRKAGWAIRAIGRMGWSCIAHHGRSIRQTLSGNGNVPSGDKVKTLSDPNVDPELKKTKQSGNGNVPSGDKVKTLSDPNVDPELKKTKQSTLDGKLNEIKKPTKKKNQENSQEKPIVDCMKSTINQERQSEIVPPLPKIAQQATNNITHTLTTTKKSQIEVSSTSEIVETAICLQQKLDNNDRPKPMDNNDRPKPIATKQEANKNSSIKVEAIGTEMEQPAAKKNKSAKTEPKNPTKPSEILSSTVIDQMLAKTEPKNPTKPSEIFSSTISDQIPTTSATISSGKPCSSPSSKKDDKENTTLKATTKRKKNEEQIKNETTSPDTLQEHLPENAKTAEKFAAKKSASEDINMKSPISPILPPSNSAKAKKQDKMDEDKPCKMQPLATTTLDKAKKQDMMDEEKPCKIQPVVTTTLDKAKKQDKMDEEKPCKMQPVVTTTLDKAKSLAEDKTQNLTKSCTKSVSSASEDINMKSPITPTLPPVNSAKAKKQDMMDEEKPHKMQPVATKTFDKAKKQDTMDEEKPRKMQPVATTTLDKTKSLAEVKTQNLTKSCTKSVSKTSSTIIQEETKTDSLLVSASELKKGVSSTKTESKHLKQSTTTKKTDQEICNKEVPIIQLQSSLETTITATTVTEKKSEATNKDNVVKINEKNRATMSKTSMTTMQDSTIAGQKLDSMTANYLNKVTRSESEKISTIQCKAMPEKNVTTEKKIKQSSEEQASLVKKPLLEGEATSLIETTNKTETMRQRLTESIDNNRKSHIDDSIVLTKQEKAFSEKKGADHKMDSLSTEIKKKVRLVDAEPDAVLNSDHKMDSLTTEIKKKVRLVDAESDVVPSSNEIKSQHNSDKNMTTKTEMDDPTNNKKANAVLNSNEIKSQHNSGKNITTKTAMDDPMNNKKASVSQLLTIKSVNNDDHRTITAEVEHRRSPSPAAMSRSDFLWARKMLECRIHGGGQTSPAPTIQETTPSISHMSSDQTGNAKRALSKWKAMELKFGR